MGSEIHKFGPSIEVWEVLHIQLEVDRLEIFVLGMHFDLVDGPIAHLWQEAGLVLRPSSKRLSCDVTVFKSGPWVACEGQDKVTAASSYDLVGVIDGKDVPVVTLVQETVLILMIKLLAYVSALDLRYLIAD